MGDRERQIEHSWRTNASAWTSLVRSGQIESRRVATDKAIVDKITEHRPRNILDVGCGEGWLVRELIRQGLEAIGIDGSPALIESARQFGVGKFEVLSYAAIRSANILSDTTYDAIICNFSLLGESIDDVLLILSTLLSDQGKLFIQTLHPLVAFGEESYRDGWRTETFASFGSAFKEPMPWYFRTVGSWLNLVRSAGLTVIDCIEPVHPVTGKPLSLLLVCTNK